MRSKGAVAALAILMSGCGGGGGGSTAASDEQPITPVAGDTVDTSDDEPTVEPPQTGSDPGLDENQQPDTDTPSTADTDLPPESPESDSPASGSPDESATDEEAQPQLPSTPSPINVRGIVYTDTEIEIFWDRADPSANIVSYQIYRDGLKLDTRDALSFYQNNLQPGTTYEYSVVAVDSSGGESEPISRFLTTREAYQAINPRNALDIVSQVASVVNEEPMQPYLSLWLGAKDFNDTNTDESASVGLEYLTSDFSTNYFIHSFGCSNNGGALEVGRTPSLQDWRGFVEADSCVAPFTPITANAVASGRVSDSWTLVRAVVNPGSIYTATFENMSATLHTGQLTQLSMGLEGQAGARSTRAWNGTTFGGAQTNYVATAFGGSTFINMNSLARTSGRLLEPDATIWERTLAADFEVQSQDTGNKAITVTTLQPFRTLSHDSCFETGVLQATGSDGSSLTLNAGNGEVDTFDLIVISNGSTISQTLAWNSSTIFRQLGGSDDLAPATVDSVCAGFYL